MVIDCTRLERTTNTQLPPACICDKLTRKKPDFTKNSNLKFFCGTRTEQIFILLHSSTTVFIHGSTSNRKLTHGQLSATQLNTTLQS